ncbi:THUMP-like domain-containing protein [Algibacter mikhailovii]|uniref:Uncharacterized protein n=1 Tax=Algibacter mikhailovii TaxID=425498 RepID=A0A918QSY5_9FLAO|nr:class I SAM-dependent methyltransferase [Algibacter mikhailovii]GGZ68049.1 hypothetical protein GCM10007028_01210 [Algibacter mikhailovii]
MNPFILNTDVQEFINANLKTDVSTLALKGTTFPKVDTKEIIEQIESKNRAKKKLPTWFLTPGIYYPNRLNIEQTSSEVTASYKSKLIFGDSIIDLTGGFGVDCFYFSQQFTTVEHCELNTSLSHIVNHNYRKLQVKNIKTIAENGISFVSSSNKTYDWIYIDPSRRHDSKGKVFFLKDCLPNVPEHLDLLFQYTKHILIKTSPLLDLSSGKAELKHVKSIHIIAVNNEVKELLWILENNYQDDIYIKAVNIKPEKTQIFETSFEEEATAISEYSLPQSFLYEPNSAVLKAGAFHAISQQLIVYKLNKHSHLYTNDKLIDFPGRRFKIEHILPYNKKNLKKMAIIKANITTRNFPETVQQIRKKHKIKDGGDLYLFFTTLMDDNKCVIITKPI